MRVKVSYQAAKSILTRTTGYLRGVTSHSLQPYIGCSFGNALCGVGCYVQHNRFLGAGQRWGSYLVAKHNAAELYLNTVDREAAWARKRCLAFTIFMSSATDPFVPHESQLRVTRSVLEAMTHRPPDRLIVQTHSHRVAGHLSLLKRLSEKCELKVHLSIESDRNTLEGLPPPASSVDKRFDAARTLHEAGLIVVITVAPLLPIASAQRFFERIAKVADGVVIDHFIGGDGSVGGARTLRTPLPQAIAELEPRANTLGYRDEMLAIAWPIMPGRVGVGSDGFAGRFLSEPPPQVSPQPY